MNISISMYSLASTIKSEKWSVTDFINYASSTPIDGVELLDMYWQENKEEEIVQVRAAMEKYDLRLAAYDVSNDFVKGTREERLYEINKVLDGIYTAKKLDGKIVRVFCGDLKEGFSYEKSFDWIVEGLKECAKIAEQEEIFLAIENHGLLAGKSSQVNDIIQAVNSPYVNATFDTGNFLLVHEKPEQAFDKLKEKIIHVHFKDFREKALDESIHGFLSTKGIELIGVIPGDGAVDLAYIVKGLKEIKYTGWLSIEYEGFEDAKMANEEAVNRLRNLLEVKS